MTLSAIINAYIKDHRENAHRELRYFRIQRDIGEVIRLAAFALRPNGKRFNHQRRIPKHALKICYDTLQSHTRRIQATRSFEELHRLIEMVLAPIRGVGELFIYDTSLRVGAYLKLEPENVYLHAGTPTGAKKLNLDCAGKYIPRHLLPTELQKLKPSEVEDVLCIYKEYLSEDTLTAIRANKNCGLSDKLHKHKRSACGMQ